MLGISTLRRLPVYRGMYLRPVYSLTTPSHRTFATHGPKYNAHVGTEVHKGKNLLCTTFDVTNEAAIIHVASPPAEALTEPGITSTVPTMVRGDWVLFHPVYSPEELKAVEVSQARLRSSQIGNRCLQVLHRQAKSFPDKIAFFLVKMARSVTQIPCCCIWL